MNAQHKINRIDNRIRRIRRRITELNADKTRECIFAEKAKREPDLGDIYAAIHRLENRLIQLNAA